MNNKKFLLLAGKPVGSIDILNYAKNLGFYTIVTDYLSKDNSPAKMLADECWDISTNNTKDIIKKAKENNISAIFTGVHEFNIARCQEICEALNLPFYATKDNLNATTHKHIYKAKWQEYGIDIIPNFTINNSNLNSFNNFPIIIKPTDGCGAYGVNICYNQEDLQKKYDNCLQYSKEKSVIAEQYIENKEEITVVYIIKDQKPYLASVADRMVKKFDKNLIPLPISYIWPSKYLNLYQEKVNDKMLKYLSDLKLNNGMVFIQNIVKDNHIYPYDMGFRLSGTQEHIILEEVCGYNPLKLLTQYSIDKTFGDQNLNSKINPNFKECACNITFLAKSSKIGKFIGLEQVQNTEGVIRVVKNKDIGEEIPQNALGTLNQIVLRVFAKAPTKEKLLTLINEIKSIVKVLDESGENILIEDNKID